VKLFVFFPGNVFRLHGPEIAPFCDKGRTRGTTQAIKEMMMAKLFLQGGTLLMHQDHVGLRAFLNACAAGDPTARRHFQEAYGEGIYNFPVKICGTPTEEAGDYYLYVFDQGRIFTRLKTFEGRQGIQFRTFLSHYVLKHLFVEWRRTRKEVETISLQTPVGNSEDGNTTLEDILPGTATVDSTSSEQRLEGMTCAPLNYLVPEEQLYLKLLSLLECHLSAEDVRLLAHISGRTVEATLALLAEVQDSLKRKDEKVARLCDELDSVWGWIILRQNELHGVQKQITLLSATENLVNTAQLLAQKRALETALAKRIRQRERLVEELRTSKLTTPYKDIARLLNTTTASVYSRISHLREQLVREIGKKEWIEEA
jgi:RNA polymerase sigma factor (sigma-70 family)